MWKTVLYFCKKIDTMKKNHKGRNSLIIAVVGLITTQILLYFKCVEGWYWYILLAGFEAGTIGGFADWFAVKALFSEIPIPFVRKHTNIIVKNREKITEGIVDLVTNQWLSPQIIKQKIANISFVDKILDSLQNTHSKNVISFLKPFLTQFIEEVDVNSFLKTEINRLNVGEYAGKFIQNNVGDSGYNKIWESVLSAVSKTINSHQTKELVNLTIQRQVNSYKEESKLKSILVTFGELSNGIDVNSISEKFINSIDEIIENAKRNPNDSIRKKIDSYVLEFSDKLIHNSPDTSKIIDDIRTKLTEIDWEGIANSIFKGGTNNPKLEQFLDKEIRKVVEKIRQNDDLKSSFDSWIKQAIEKIIAKNHNEIGEMVATSLANLDDKQMVAQIEEKVGNDLQYIRLNGAVVGGLIGVIIALLRMLLLN